ncbi:predicted protein [Naegleria gruberi]|uniref:Predicted protein n=1 Tax=Naegleria gruberi TaxID=5762 RepID=D2VFN1_NAEGR|nr:uncharacterized protein NAEGRDRAFT_49149 [Naegleria gruberi]EFC44501.1 predicted protein [Naegleria gruberi]|eukprot:XP_002677245.1 predicted protein [Naegleria gruberi strain NEG-M]
MYSKSESSIGSKWSSFLMSANRNNPLTLKLKQFYNSQTVTFEEWRRMFKSCKEKYPSTVSEIANTPVHASIFKQLSHRAFLLESGYFVRKTGVSNIILVGNSGIGKSMTYKNFVQSCQVFHPKVIPIYLTYEHICGNESFKKTVPIDLIFSELEREHSLKRKKSGYSDKLHELSTLLESSDKYLMLIIDNVEKVYELNTKDFPKAHAHIAWLSTLAGDSSGRIPVTLSCSNFIPSSEVNIPFKSERAFSPSKFLEIRLPSVKPTNSKNIEEFLKCKSGRANEITFLTGGNMREISKLLVMEELDISYSISDSHKLGDDSNQFLLEITKKMLEINTEFFESLCSDNRGILARLFDFSLSKENIELDMNKVRKANLESFTPLKYSEAMKLWIALQEEPIPSNFKQQLGALHDSGNLIVDGDEIYPISLFSLFQLSRE